MNRYKYINNYVRPSIAHDIYYDGLRLRIKPNSWGVNSGSYPKTMTLKHREQHGLWVFDTEQYMGEYGFDNSISEKNMSECYEPI